MSTDSGIANKNKSTLDNVGNLQKVPSNFYQKFQQSYSLQDKISLLVLQSLAITVILTLVLVIYRLISISSEAISEFGFEFITTSFWNPVEDEFGGLAFIYGTLVTSIVALILATPVSIAVALFINEILPEWAKKTVSLFVEMIAAIPSIVFGLWGFFFLAPFVKDPISIILKKYFGFLPIFQGPSFGIGVLTASIILAIMITPTISSICREVFASVPKIQKEAALALGATRYEMIKLAVLKPSFSGIVGAIVLGLGRALGETMAVAMVIGNTAEISASLFAPGATMASVIANEYNEASDLHLAALTFVALLLFGVTFVINALARYIVSLKVKK